MEDCKFRFYVIFSYFDTEHRTGCCVYNTVQEAANFAIRQQADRGDEGLEQNIVAGFEINSVPFGHAACDLVNQGPLPEMELRLVPRRK